MSYWDTSTLVKLYASEADSPSFESHARNSTSHPITSRIAVYEAHATFRRKEAEGVLTTGGAQTLVQTLLQDVGSGMVQIIEIGSEIENEYTAVLNFCYQQTPPILLRTLDALHLASLRVAKETELVATDKRLRDAAKAMGFLLFPV